MVVGGDFSVGACGDLVVVMGWADMLWQLW